MNQHLSLMTAGKPVLSKVGINLTQHTISAKICFGLTNSIVTQRPVWAWREQIPKVNRNRGDCWLFPSPYDTHRFCSAVERKSMPKQQLYRKWQSTWVNNANNQPPTNVCVPVCVCVFRYIWGHLECVLSTVATLLSELQASVAVFLMKYLIRRLCRAVCWCLK